MCVLVAQSCPTLCHPMDCSVPGLPVPHHLSEFAQVHDRWISDTIQPSHPLSSSLPAFSLSQHQGLFLACRLFLLRSFGHAKAWHYHLCAFFLSCSESCQIQACIILLLFTVLSLGVILFLTKWRFVVTLHWASLSVLFFQQHLFASCLHVLFW